MDFLFSNNPHDLDKCRAIIGKFAKNYPAKTLHTFSGFWGCLVATGSHHLGLEPFETEECITLVSGDPLSGAASTKVPAGALSSARSKAISEQWQKSGDAMQIHHPAAILLVSKKARNINLMTDAWGAVSAYATEDSEALVLGSSPDLIAMIHPCSFDRISAMELICNRIISFPNTLYTNIKELPPAATTSFENNKRQTQKWWTPPLPEESIPIEEWASKLQDCIEDTLIRIRSEVAEKGMATLSAGLDSRFVLSLIKQKNLLEVTGINLAAAAGTGRAIAQQIATRLNVPIEYRTRRIDHYAAAMLDGHPEIGSNVCLSDAHFCKTGLGNINQSRFLIGGYTADSILVGNNNLLLEKMQNLNSKKLDTTAPSWAINPSYKKLSQTDSNAISQRREQSGALLGLTEQHSQLMQRMYPANQLGTKGHFEAARRSYPMYEPFMTKTALELGFRIPDQIKKTNSKSLFFGHYLNSTADIPTNPVRTKLSKLKTKVIKKFVPFKYWPKNMNLYEWKELKGPLARPAKKQMQKAVKILSQTLGIDLSDIKNKRTRVLITTTVQALSRCKPQAHTKGNGIQK